LDDKAGMAQEYFEEGREFDLLLNCRHWGELATFQQRFLGRIIRTSEKRSGRIK